MEIPSKVVKDEVTSQQPSEGNEAVEEATAYQEPVQAGDKTPPNLLLEAKQIEAEKRRMAEEKVKILEEKLKAVTSNENTFTDDDFSEEGKLFKKDISEVKSEVQKIKEEGEKQKVFATYPVLMEKVDEFEEYRSKTENYGMPIMTAAKAFLAENDMLESPRKGLEKTTGGDKATPLQGMTTDEVKSLRENNYNEYKRLLTEDKIKIVPKK